MNYETIINSLIQQKKLVHALLFHGRSNFKIIDSITLITQMILCHNLNSMPCKQCRSCHALACNAHPDVTTVKADNQSSSIKIDKIRNLINIVYLSSTFGAAKVIQIIGVDHLHAASSNALLKMLEEPPQNVYFLLQAASLCNIAPTIISRCQIWHIPELITEFDEFAQFLTIEGANSQVEMILPTLQGLFMQQLSICDIASQLMQYELKRVIQIFYWFYAWFISHILGNNIYPHQLLQTLSPKLRPYLTLAKLFQQLDKINMLMSQLDRSIPLHPLMTLEAILLELC